MAFRNDVGIPAPLFRSFPVSLFLLLASARAFAQDPAPPPPEAESPLDLAKRKADEAGDLFDAKKFQEALERYSEADDLYHTPFLVLYEARCQVGLGKLVEAARLYQRVIDEPLPDSANDSVREAQAEAAKELAELKKRLPKLRVRVQGTPKEQTHVQVDGIEATPWDESIVLNPGNHRVDASAQGAMPGSTLVRLDEGVTTEVTLSLAAIAPAAPLGPVTPARAPLSAPPRKPAWPAGLTLGVGAGGLLVGVVTGALALSLANELKEKCEDGVCPPSSCAARDKALTLATASNVAFVLGGTGTITGVGLYVGGFGRDARQIPSTGMTGAGLWGTF